MSWSSSFPCISKGYVLGRLDGFPFSKWLLLSKLFWKRLLKLLQLFRCLKLFFWFLVKSHRLNVLYLVDLINCSLLVLLFSELCWLTGFSVIQFFRNHSSFLENSCCDFSFSNLHWCTHSLRTPSEMCPLRLSSKMFFKSQSIYLIDSCCLLYLIACNLNQRSKVLFIQFDFIDCKVADNGNILKLRCRLFSVPNL